MRRRDVRRVHYASRLSSVFAETPKDGRGNDGSQSIVAALMLAARARAADPIGVRDPARKHVLVCGGCGYGVVVVIPPSRCPMCGAFDWQPERRNTPTLGDV
jgi:rubrerythrin